MAFCGKCGNQLEEGAKFCPKCGQPTNQQPYENNNESLNSVSNEENLVTLEKICAAFEELGLSKQIAFGLTGALAVFGILWGFNNMDIKFMVICLLSVAGLYYILKGVIKPKYTWWIAIGTLIIVLIATTTTIEKDKQTEQKSEQSQEEKQTEQKSEQSQEEKQSEQKSKKSKEDEIRALGHNDGVKYGYSDRGQHLRDFVQMGMSKEAGLTDIKLTARAAYKVDNGNEISEELLDIYADSFIEGYKSIVLK